MVGQDGFNLNYIGTSKARTLMAHSPGLARTIIMIPTCHFMHNSPWIAGTTLDTYFHGPKNSK